MTEQASPRLVILLDRSITPAAAQSALRYASTAAAMDIAVEVHAVSASVALLRRDAAAGVAAGVAGDQGWQAALDQALELGVELYACPQALAEQGMQAEDLIDGVAGVRGAPSLLTAGLAPGGRFMVF